MDITQVYLSQGYTLVTLENAITAYCILHSVIMYILVADIFSTLKSLPFTGMRNQINNYLYAAFLIIEEIFEYFFDNKSNICRLEIITHRSNIQLDHQSLFGLHVYSCTTTTDWLRPPPPHAFGLIYEGAIGQPRQTTSLYDPCNHIKAVHKEQYYMHQRFAVREIYCEENS